MAHFRSESQMSFSFREFLESLLKEEDFFFFREYRSPFGIPDFIIAERNNENLSCVIAIELKLKDWKKAAKQAFRYRSFSHQAFVVVDKGCLTPALSNISYFVHFNIGLASFDNSKDLKIHYFPEKLEPFSIDFFQKAESDLLSKRERIKDYCHQLSSSDFACSILSSNQCRNNLSETLSKFT